MASITPVISKQVGDADGSAQLVTWTLTTANIDGLAVELSEWADITWQATGTFGGATAAAEGSNDGSTWFGLTNVAGGAAATFAATGGKATNERPRYIRANLTAVGAGATIVVTALVRRSNSMRT